MVSITFMVNFHYIYGWYYIHGFYFIYWWYSYSLSEVRQRRILILSFSHQRFGTYRNQYCLMKKVNDFEFQFATFSQQNITSLDGKI